MQPTHFISVDWGSSNFRMRMVEKSSLHTVEEILAPVGIKTLDERWVTEGGDRETYFVRFLEQQRLRFSRPVAADTVMMVSGMASSDIGVRELPYAPLPVSLDGTHFHMTRFKHSACSLEICLVSGLCTGDDIMRGEEVQVLGLSVGLDPAEKTVLVLPGTHSKHVICHQHEILDFTTFFTGELFELLATHSMLKGSLDPCDPEFSGAEAFEQGVQTSFEGVPLLHSVFRVRAWDRLGKKSPRENFHYLSGLVIGAELAALKGRGPERIWLCAGKRLAGLYGKAIALSDLKGKTKIISERDVEQAVIIGHGLLLDSR